jgi:hypothetical protein
MAITVRVSQSLFLHVCMLPQLSRSDEEAVKEAIEGWFPILSGVTRENWEYSLPIKIPARIEFETRKGSGWRSVRLEIGASHPDLVEAFFDQVFPLFQQRPELWFIGIELSDCSHPIQGFANISNLKRASGG